MGIFDKLKNIFKKEEKEEVQRLMTKDLKKPEITSCPLYLNLNKNHKLVDDDYFENSRRNT